MSGSKILIYSLFFVLLSLYVATVKSSNKIALTFDTQCITACTGSPNEETSIDQLTSQLINSTIANTQAIKQIVEQVNNQANTLKKTTSTVNKVLQLVEELTELHRELLPTSCQEIKQRKPNSPSGMYQIATQNNNTTQYVYCHMEELCGSNEGWTRLAYLNMSDPSVECPCGFRLYESGGVRACGRPVSLVGSCVSVKYPSNDISYSEVCGRVVGYAYHSPDAVDKTIGPTQHNDINSFYVDGVSITHGTPRKHIWTLMAGLSEKNNWGNGKFTCPCQQGSQQSAYLQSFIGNDYFCEAGLPTDYIGAKVFYTSDPLWDGKQCGSLEQNCCNIPSLPWFHKVLSSNTNTDDIELRICCDQNTDDEDVPLNFYEIFVK